MSFEIVRNSIVNVRADALVNTANPKVAVGPGVDAAIYAAAGRYTVSLTATDGVSTGTYSLPA